MIGEPEYHVKANSSAKPDLYAKPPKGSLWENDPCGCALAPCGFVIPNRECKYHGDRPIIRLRKGHFATNCPGGPH